MSVTRLHVDARTIPSALAPVPVDEARPRGVPLPSNVRAAEELMEWWEGFSERWNWEDPALLLTVLTVLVTALIPILIWRLGSKQSSRDSDLRKQQADSLDRQERILRRQRRDALLVTIEQSTDETHLMLLWSELLEFDGRDRQLLRSAFRANVSVALPGSHVGGVSVADELDDQAVADYIAGLAILGR